MENKTEYNFTRAIGYIATFIGSFMGIYSFQATGNIIHALDLFIQIGVIPLSICAFLWHTLFSGNVHPEQTTHFFEYEAGGANLAVGLVLLATQIFYFGPETICSILLVYLIYLFVGAVTHWIYEGSKGFIKFCPLLGILIYFIYIGFKYNPL